MNQPRSQDRPRRSFTGSPLFLIAAILAVVGVLAVYLKIQAPAQPPQAEAPAPTNTATATRAAVGDLTISDVLAADALQSDGSYDFGSCLLNVTPLLSGADLTVGNLELTFSGSPYGGENASAPDSLAAALGSAGFDLLQTANSKSLAGGISGLRSTLSTLQANGLTALGTFGTQAALNDAGHVVLREVNGIRIAFFAFTKGFGGMSIPTGSEYCASLLYTDYNTAYQKIDRDAILAVIDEAQALDPDVIVAMVHWGSEYRMTVSQSQKDIAKLMFTNGVDVILGSHSHMVGPMETQHVTTASGEEKDVFVAYSLGNFLSSADETYTRESVVLNLEFVKDLDTGKTTIGSTDYVPVYLADFGEDAANRFQTLEIAQAMELYDSAYLGRVNEATYNAMQQALEDLAKHTAPPEETASK